MFKFFKWLAECRQEMRRKQFQRGYDYGMAKLVASNGCEDPTDDIWPDDHNAFDDGIVAAAHNFSPVIA